MRARAASQACSNCCSIRAAATTSIALPTIWPSRSTTCCRSSMRRNCSGSSRWKKATRSSPRTGAEFANSEILRQKEIFRDAALENVLLLRQIRRALEAKSDHTVPEEFFLDMLDEQFSEEESQRQMETAVTWGRYAEMFDFDAGTPPLCACPKLGGRGCRRGDASEPAAPFARSLVTVRTWPVVHRHGRAAFARLALFLAIVHLAATGWAPPFPCRRSRRTRAPCRCMPSTR